MVDIAGSKLGLLTGKWHKGKGSGKNSDGWDWASLSYHDGKLGGCEPHASALTESLMDPLSNPSFSAWW